MKVMTLITLKMKMKMKMEVGDDDGYPVMTCDVLPVTMFMDNTQICFATGVAIAHCAILYFHVEKMRRKWSSVENVLRLGTLGCQGTIGASSM